MSITLIQKEGSLTEIYESMKVIFSQRWHAVSCSIHTEMTETILLVTAKRLCGSITYDAMVYDEYTFWRQIINVTACR